MKGIAALACALSLSLSTAHADGSHELAREDSEIIVRTDRAGLFSFAGHRHRILVEEFTAEISAPAPREPLAIDVVIDALSLTVIDDDLDAEKIAEVQAEMESSVLEVETHPAIRAALVLAALPDGDGAFNVELRGDLTLHGTTREVVVPATLLLAGRRLQVRGTAVVKQTDYGIRPVSVGKGAVKVKDEVEIDFSLVSFAPLVEVLDEGKGSPNVESVEEAGAAPAHADSTDR